MRKEPTRTDLAIVYTIQCIRSCITYEQLVTCKRLITLLEDNYNIRYLTGKYIKLRYKQKLYELQER